MMAVPPPRRYFSLSAGGAIAIRLPPTSSRMYTSSVSDPLANTSKTSSAASSVASGRWFIICSTAVQERRVMRSPSKSGPRVSRNGSDRQDVGPHPSPQPVMGCSRRSRGATRATGGRARGGAHEEAGPRPGGTTAMPPGRRTTGAIRGRRRATPLPGARKAGAPPTGPRPHPCPNGTGVRHACGGYPTWLLPPIRGQAVVVIEYGVQPAADGKSLISAAVTGFVKLENPLVEMASRLLSRTATAKAEREARQLVKVFARTTRAIEHDPAGVHELLRLRPDVSRPELEAFRRLLRFPWRAREALAERRDARVEPDRRLLRGDGRLAASLFQERPPQPRVRVGVVGLLRDDGAGGVRQLAELALRLERVPEGVVGTGLVEVEADRLPAEPFGLGVPPPGEQPPAARRPRAYRVRLDADRRAVRGLCVRPAVALGQPLGEVAVGADVIRLEPDRLTKGGLGLGVAALPVERHAEAPVERGGRGPEAKRLVVRHLRVPLLPLTAEAEREVRPRLERVAAEANRLAERDLGLRMPALPAERDAELVVEICVVASERECALERGGRARVIAERAAREGPPRGEGRVVGLDRERLGGHGRLLRPAALAPQ